MFFGHDDIEEQCLALLGKIHLDHPVLREWISRLARDSTYYRSIDEYLDTEVGEPAIKDYLDAGYSVSNLADSLSTSTGRLFSQAAPAIAKTDSAAYWLAYALTQYRAHDRPASWRTKTVDGWQEFTLASELLSFRHKIDSIWGSWDRCPKAT